MFCSSQGILQLDPLSLGKKEGGQGSKYNLNHCYNQKVLKQYKKDKVIISTRRMDSEANPSLR